MARQLQLQVRRLVRFPLLQLLVAFLVLRVRYRLPVSQLQLVPPVLLIPLRRIPRVPRVPVYQVLLVVPHRLRHLLAVLLAQSVQRV